MAVAPRPCVYKLARRARCGGHVQESCVFLARKPRLSTSKFLCTLAILMAEKQLRFVRHARAVAPCANNCGFFGVAATKNLCSRCYRDHLNAVANAAEVERMQALLASLAHREVGSFQDATAATPAPAMEKPAANRCATCRKKVGLLGFACRCGGMFCSMHRHADAHGCGFDCKKADHERIAEQNPVVVAPKIAKF